MPTGRWVNVDEWLPEKDGYYQVMVQIKGKDGTRMGTARWQFQTWFVIGESYQFGHVVSWFDELAAAHAGRTKK